MIYHKFNTIFIQKCSAYEIAEEIMHLIRNHYVKKSNSVIQEFFGRLGERIMHQTLPNIKDEERKFAEKSAVDELTMKYHQIIELGNNNSAQLLVKINYICAQLREILDKIININEMADLVIIESMHDELFVVIENEIAKFPEEIAIIIIHIYEKMLEIVNFQVIKKELDNEFPSPLEIKSLMHQKIKEPQTKLNYISNMLNNFLDVSMISYQAKDEFKNIYYHYLGYIVAELINLQYIANYKNIIKMSDEDIFGNIFQNPEITKKLTDLGWNLPITMHLQI